MTSNLVLHASFLLNLGHAPHLQSCLRIALPLLVILIQASAIAATKPHVITFGKWTTVQWFPESGTDAADDKPLTLKVRPLLVDAHVKEFTLGPAHDVTDRLFVVRRAFRVNDSLPQESTSPPHWQWQRGGWLLVDRATGHISLINLPEFDVFYSAVSWYRDYAAYCGVSDDGKRSTQSSPKSTAASRFSRSPSRGATIADKETKDVSSRFRLPHARLATNSRPRNLRARRRHPNKPTPSAATVDLLNETKKTTKKPQNR